MYRFFSSHSQLLPLPFRSRASHCCSPCSAQRCTSSNFSRTLTLHYSPNTTGSAFYKMSHHHVDYANNIDDQLLSVAKQEGVMDHHDLDARVNLEQIAHAARMDPQRQQNQQNHQHPQSQNYLNHHYQGVDPSEYNIQIPEPIVDSKLKIYPVSENTITADGNLITKPYPEQAFHSRDDLNDYIHEFARDNGFGVVIAHLNKKAIYYTCELGGRYRHKKGKSAEAEVSNQYMDAATKTKKLRCPFSMTASYKKSTGVWTLRTTCNEHNHPQLDPLSNHPMLRKRSDELNLLILDLYKVGTKPSHIESKIKEQFPDVLIKREDIYNEIRGYKRKLKKARYLLGPAHDANNRGFKKRTNANSFQQVDLDDDNDPPNDQVLQFELQRQHQQDAELQRQLAAHHHQHHGHLDDHQLQYQMDGGNDDSTTAAAIAAVANAHHGDLGMDNIDSRLVGE